MDIMYRINNNKDYGFYESKDEVRKKDLKAVHDRLSHNGIVKMITVLDGKVIDSHPRLNKTERDLIVKRHNYTIKRGL